MDNSHANAGLSKETAKRPFAAAWINRFHNWIDRLPGAPWPYYLGAVLILIAVPTTVQWIEGALPIGAFLLVEIFIATAIAFMLGLLQFLDRRAGAALMALRPALRTIDEQRESLHYQITHMPSWGALLASVIALVTILITEAASAPFLPVELVGFSVSLAVFRVIYLFGWWVFGAFCYHTLHQLMMISRIYTRHTNVNLFRIKPLYAFSNLTALTAGSLTLITYGWRAVAPSESIDDPISLAIMIVILLLALVAFLWPQLGIHSLQVAEKDRLIEEANRRFELTILELHKRVDSGKLGTINELSTALTALEKELSALQKIPTWPWQPETVRWLVTALVLPLGLWIIQFVLQRVLGS
jgi:hypothetical protein